MKFGTDGFRGPTDKKITPEFCLNLGFHTGRIIASKGYDSVIIGKDTRVSGYMLESALQAGFISAGIDVKLAGPIPTPAVSFLTATYPGQFGVVISASHNPYEDNGIKFFNRFGRKISDDLEKIIENELAGKVKPVTAGKLGKAFRIDSAGGRYIEYCKSTLRGKYSLKNTTILVDGANGANYKITPTLLEELGAKVIRVNCDPDGFNINDKSAVLDETRFKEYAEKYDYDFCAAVDGDGDRLVLSNSKGEVFSGDDLLYLLAIFNQHKGLDGSKAVVGTQMTNQGVADALQAKGVDLLRSDVGDKYISRMLVEENLLVGAESSGHIIQRNFSESGDANIALLQSLLALEVLQTELEKIKGDIEYYPYILESFRLDDLGKVDQTNFKEFLQKTKKENANTRISVRKSGTEPLVRVMVESKTGNIKNILNNIKEQLI